MLPKLLRRIVLVVGLSVVVLACARTGFGQGFQGGLRGAIRDAGGGVPGAAVTITNENTNLARATLTNGQGEYAFAAVEPGTYRVKVTLTGFKTIERAAVRIGTQSFLILDLGLEVGSIEESITVTAQAPLIETSNASTGTVLDTQALQSLPAPGRNAFMIGTTIPTVIASGDAQYNRQQDQTNSSLISLGGGTRRGNNYTLDGVPITDLRNRASANPTIEALDDVKVQVHTYDAEMGRTGGGVFNTTLRSGTNNWRGTGFFQNRPIWGQTNNYFSELAGVGKPDSPYYLGGGSLGGPIVRNRTFFWFAAENYYDVQSRNATELCRRPQNATVTSRRRPTPRGSRSSSTTRSPASRSPATSFRPTASIPCAAIMLKYLPLPDVELANGTTNYTRTSPINNSERSSTPARCEHKFTDNISLTGFYL